MHPQVQLIFVFLVETELYHVGQAGLELLGSPGKYLLLECNGTILAHCNLCLLGSSDSHTSACQIAGILGMCHQGRLIFIFVVEMGSRYVAQDGLELLASSDWPTLTSQSVGITSMSHCVWPII